MGGRTDITEHLNRISSNQNDNQVPLPQRTMGLSDNQRVTEQRLPSRGEEFENRMETATSGINKD